MREDTKVLERLAARICSTIAVEMGEQTIKKRKDYKMYSMVKTRAITDSEESETNLDSATDQGNSEVTEGTHQIFADGYKDVIYPVIKKKKICNFIMKKQRMLTEEKCSLLESSYRVQKT